MYVNLVRHSLASWIGIRLDEMFLASKVFERGIGGIGMNNGLNLIITSYASSSQHIRGLF